MIRSSLSRHVPRSPASSEEIEAMCRRAWVERGQAVIDPDTIEDEWTRRALVTEMTRRYGETRRKAG